MRRGRVCFVRGALPLTGNVQADFAAQLAGGPAKGRSAQSLPVLLWHGRDLGL